eukprot:4013441-Pleurochrysis_carterae.AAC.1
MGLLPRSRICQTSALWPLDNRGWRKVNRLVGEHQAHLGAARRRAHRRWRPEIRSNLPLHGRATPRAVRASFPGCFCGDRLCGHVTLRL